jgi:uncharacterized protein (DUF302 family)
MKKAMLAAILALSVAPVTAGAQQPETETRTIETSLPFSSLVERLREAVTAHDMGIVAEACASCGARARGIEIPGNQVIMVFRNDFAVRMLRADVSAGIEAPLRFYVTESEDGADLTWQVPSVVFAPYGSPALTRMADEMDVIFTAIAEQAVAEGRTEDARGGNK